MAESETVDVEDETNQTGWILLSYVTVCFKDPAAVPVHCQLFPCRHSVIKHH